MNKVSTVVGAVVLTLAGSALLSFLLSGFVYILWNGCLVDAVTGVKEVTWLQAWGISLLCGILFKTHIYKKD